MIAYVYIPVAHGHHLSVVERDIVYGILIAVALVLVVAMISLWWDR